MAQPFNIFIVEDDLWYGEVLEYLLKLNPEYNVEKFTSGKDCIKNLHKRPSLVTLDYSLDDMTGIEVLRQIKQFDAEIPVVVISGQEDVSTAVNLLREGAYDYIVKDDDAKDRLWNVVKNIREKKDLQAELEGLREEIGARYDFANLIGTSQPIQKVKKLMEKAVNTNITVSINGETGTGKEVVAKGIHYNSTRKKKPFVAVNVAAIPSELIESELFGYEKGAFTGAETARKGKFEEADGGTLFLDEIGEMDPAMQSKLLRAIQEKEITRIGGNATKKVNVRLVVATHKNLSEEVENGNFREDLYYRLLGLPIILPPLRERGNDILMLARFFVDAFSKDNGLGNVEITEEARQKLLKYPFPGNVRELKALMELAAVMSSNGVIESDDITFTSTRGISGLLSEERSLREYTTSIIKHFLDKYDNNVLLVARKLDIGKSTIYRMLKNEEL
ncbi:sigma-54-dependent transcriptional regulator [Sanyastnella coralliicola]|uniref:sigma-54-dependent transcriptional regulator n=1 Tax=Sanyastnella coralliicola TaxID=3069118 RepID=UPI0027B8B6FB|nr:sigma-54 dependent transcriptional regulator [Longitalea sp. SCSIO 12813]